jgi:outer membrane lipopolysaccharide assembly protein LptE/RlpB
MSFEGIALLLLVAVLSLGCGIYTFTPRGKSEISTIAIERFENRTSEYGLADRMTDLVIDAFIADGNLKVVSEDKADAVLYGVLTSYARKPYTYDQNDQVQEYQVIMNFKITLKNPRDQSEIWTETMNQTGTYDVISETEEDAQNKAIGYLVESIINKTTKSW